MPLDLPKIKKLMHQRGITQKQLASALQVSIGSIYRKLEGKTEFNGNQVGKLAEVLNVSVAVLYGLHEEKPQGGIF